MKDAKIRYGWLRFMYVYTFIGAGFTGLGMLAAPAKMQAILNWPAVEPISYGILASLYLTFGLVSLLGLRDPLKFVPLLLAQLVYKVIYMVALILPMLIAGKLPAYATAQVIIFLSYIIGDLIAIPFPYVFAAPNARLEEHAVKA